jgi:1-acyl-sn-glycerol-3-phosphate acyltransferase
MLSPSFFARYRVTPTPWLHHGISALVKAEMGLVGHRIIVEGSERLLDRPALYCTNSTQTYDFLTFLRALHDRRRPVVTVTKAKNYHQPAMAFVLRRKGVVPLASRGYLILLDVMATVGRRPTDSEYRALRDHVDRGVPLPDDALTRVLGARRRRLLDHAYDGDGDWGAFIQRVFAACMQETLRLMREAVVAGYSVQIYPEGTVSPRLGVGRSGAVQFAHALSLPVVPVGMSGCPAAYRGTSPVPARGRVTMRVGEVVDVALPPGHIAFDPGSERQHAAALTETTARVMEALNGLLDPPFRRGEGPPPPGKGLRAHL